MPLIRTASIVGLASLLATAPAHAQRVAGMGLTSYGRGVELLQRHQLKEAEQSFLAAIGSTNPGERVAAARALALTAWRYRANDRSAQEYLKLALGLQL